jgi:hypothetical protein
LATSAERISAAEIESRSGVGRLPAEGYADGPTNFIAGSSNEIDPGRNTTDRIAGCSVARLYGRETPLISVLTTARLIQRLIAETTDAV